MVRRGSVVCVVQMMRILTLALCVMLIGLFAPSGAAAETVAENYTGSLGAAAAGESYGTILNPPSEYSDLPVPGLSPVGGAHLRTTTFYNSVIVAPSDDIFGSEGAIAVCFWAFGGDSQCDGEDAASPPGCGATLLSSPGLWRGAQATVWAFTVLIEDDLTVCGGTTGRVTGDFFNV